MHFGEFVVLVTSAESADPVQDHNFCTSGACVFRLCKDLDFEVCVPPCWISLV